MGGLAGHNITTIDVPNANGNAILMLDVVLGDSRNGNEYICVVPQGLSTPDIRSDSAFLYVAGK